MGANVDSPSYVDRGGLDGAFQRSLTQDRHIVVHGGSKQGKSWLRKKMLPMDKSIVIQCTPESTVESIITEALSKLGVIATLRITTGSELQGQLDFSANMELNAAASAKLSVGMAKSSSAVTRTSEEGQPIGRTPANLSWVSTTLLESGKRLVIEDFHYVRHEVQRSLAFLLKALGEYGLYVVIVGVWIKEHLLTYFNGDLDGRVNDIHLQWSDQELGLVLGQGSQALGITFDDDLSAQLVEASFGNVGLLHRITERLCLAEGITETPGPVEPRAIDAGPSLDMALSEVASQMQGRFETFADNFVRGMRRMSEGLEVYRHLLEAATHASDAELQMGIDSKTLHERIIGNGSTEIRASDLTQALERIDKLQSRIGINPPVFNYQKSNRRLQLTDAYFLFFRAFGQPAWPWDKESSAISNDLATSEPLDLSDE